MVNKMMLWAGVLVCVCAVATVAEAQPSRAAKAKHADRNDDGKVDRKELHMEQSWQQRHLDNNSSPVPARLSDKARATTVVEQKYDANQDGVLERAEARQMVKDRYEIIKTQGKAKVDSAIETQYDVNHDGVLDRSEAAAMISENN
ncbi:MAG TPA: hypothetical protein P5110_02390 [Candidatus Omnitrophota bacterium]|nr:hypothetical protein [Candidatus Omnitrophota bacterium]HRZ14336.1 hypothetical protein [Candidatus Omnitrophota bacterium]